MEATTEQHPPTPLEEAIGKMPHLMVGDIVLVRHKRSLSRHYLRKVMRSYWDHATIVLYPRDLSVGRPYSIVAESIRHGLKSTLFSHGVTLHKLDRYLMDPGKYEIGIKRIPSLNEEDRHRVWLYAMMNVDAPYWPWSAFRMFLASFSAKWSEKVRQSQRFSCTSFVQEAYYDAMPWDRKTEVIFRPDAWSPLELQEMTGPGDIADSDKAAWIYNERKYDGR